MFNLIWILLTLFIVLVAVVKLTEKYARPISPQKQAKLSRIAMVLIMLLLVGRWLQYYFTQ